jgi:dTDP-4-dehydrorhamnose reductase
LRKRVVVTGKSGQVVSALQAVLEQSTEFELICLGRPELEFENLDGIEAQIVAARPDYVVNAAAYTAVDKAEDEAELAIRVNAEAAGAVARGAAKVGAPVIQISTDYVFDGSKDGAYNEGDIVGPIGSYGRSKLLGEKEVAAANPHHIIIRTSWVYSPYGANFVKTMLRYGAERDVMKVVDDQHGNPTSAHDIADGIVAAMRQMAHGEHSGLGQIYHFAGQGDTTWFNFAQAIFDESAMLGGPKPVVEPIKSGEFATKAKRPENSRLNCAKFQAQFAHTIPAWRTSLHAVMKQLLSAV